MKSDLEFMVNEEAVGGVTLDNAVLIYRGTNGTAFATVHPIHNDEAGRRGRPPSCRAGR